MSEVIFIIEFVILSGVWRGFLRQTQSKYPEEAHTAPTLRPFLTTNIAELLRQDTSSGFVLQTQALQHAVTDFAWEDYNFERCEAIDFEGAKLWRR